MSRARKAGRYELKEEWKKDEKQWSYVEMLTD